MGFINELITYNNGGAGAGTSPFGGFLQWGYPNSWMVYNRKSGNKMDHLAVPPFWEISIFHGETMVK